MTEDIKRIEAALAAYFPAEALGYKPQVVQNTRALAVFYIDAGTVQERLDAVLGSSGWSDDYEAMPDGSVICRLRVRFGEQWVSKADVGAPSKGTGDKLKGAFSDALKRAAAKFGVGRYLRRIPMQWCAYNPQKKQFTESPRVPAQFLPPKEPSKNGNGTHQPQQGQAQNQNGQQGKQQQAAGSQAGKALITREHGQYLAGLLQKAGLRDQQGNADFRGILAHFKAEKLSQLNVEQYQQAIRLIQSDDPAVFPPDDNQQ